VNRQFWKEITKFSQNTKKSTLYVNKKMAPPKSAFCKRSGKWTIQNLQNLVLREAQFNLGNFCATIIHKWRNIFISHPTQSEIVNRFY
jgi:hypothetical protein